MDGWISKQGSCTSNPAWLTPLSSFPTRSQQEHSLPHITLLSWHGVSAGKLVVSMLQDLIQQYTPRVSFTGSSIVFWEKEPRRSFCLQSCCKLISWENSLLVSWRVKSMVYQKLGTWEILKLLWSSKHSDPKKALYWHIIISVFFSSTYSKKRQYGQQTPQLWVWRDP